MGNFFDLTEKIIVITGASRGLGKNMALGLSEVGATIVGVATSMERLEVTKKEIEENGGRCVIFKADIGKEDEVEALTAFLENEFGRVDVLINNAGIHRRNLIVDIPKEDWDAVIAVNLTGMFLCIKHMGKLMQKNKSGKIINIASIMANAGLPMAAIYCSTKGAVQQLTKTAAIEFATDNIQVNAIGPGYFETEINDKYLKNPELKQIITDRIPVGRWGKKDELIGTAIYLSSDASSYVTGQTIFVDGGYLAV